MNHLTVAEKFFSIQGEGPTVGRPAYFIRLKQCNLMCGGVGGKLMKEGKATWWCDTETVWKQGVEIPYSQIIEDWRAEGILDRVLNGNIHIVWTGGEPTMPKSQAEIKGFMNYVSDTLNVSPQEMYHEIETNGTIKTEEDFYGEYIYQVNCSPKLANSGMKQKLRIVPDAIRQISNFGMGYFKFVISTEDDIKEIRETYIEPFDIEPERIIIMPGVDNLKDLPERTKFLFEMTKKYGYRGITRQHILAWDKTTGV